MKEKTFVGILALLFLAGCATAPKVDLTTFVTDPTPKVNIPSICKPLYDTPLPLVAVVNFTNNTTFDYASVVQSQMQGTRDRTAVGGAAVGVVPGAAGVVWGKKEKENYQASAETISRQVNAKLSESIEDGVMDEIVNMGGAKVFTRKEMEKIFSEHKFQQSGLVDDSTIIRLGKLKGVKYIITGSVNNVDIKWVTHESARRGLTKGTGSVVVDLLGTAAAAALETQEGWNLGTEITVRILDVESGEVVFSKKLAGRYVIGKTPTLTFDAIIGAIKKAAGNSLQNARPELSKYFPLKGYITLVKRSADGKEKAVRVNIGEKAGLKPGHELYVYNFEEVVDPMSGKKECDVQRLPLVLQVSADQLQQNAAWALVKAEKPELLNLVKVGQLVERKPIR
ncbi:MAG: CsgG/HfaB family protein [Syntrophales bacterium]|nr:CsgG/HfaB family protein [Syntrophales bacterium]